MAYVKSIQKTQKKGTTIFGRFMLNNPVIQKAFPPYIRSYLYGRNLRVKLTLTLTLSEKDLDTIDYSRRTRVYKAGSIVGSTSSCPGRRRDGGLLEGV